MDTLLNGGEHNNMSSYYLSDHDYCLISERIGGSICKVNKHNLYLFHLNIESLF